MKLNLTSRQIQLLFFLGILTFLEVLLINTIKCNWLLMAAFLVAVNLGLFLFLSRIFIRKIPPFIPLEENITMFSTLQIANETLSFMRLGLNEETAKQSAEIIQNISGMAAVAITDKEKVLAFIGVGCDQHQPGEKILTEATKKVIRTGEYAIVPDHKALNCSRQSICDCPLGSAVIAPLKSSDKVVGSLKLYSTSFGRPPSHIIRLTIGIAQLLSLQMELAELDRQAQLLTQAQLEALHAQINPHFFFNTLNTIIMYSRTDPEKTRNLLINLAELFRKTLTHKSRYITLKEELTAVDTYFTLEEARFGDKIRLIKTIEEKALNYEIPVLSIQPLVENAVKHGLSPKIGTGTVTIDAKIKRMELHIKVADDGVGIPKNRLSGILNPGVGSGNGVGLSNVHERLKSLYGNEYGLKVESKEGVGTKIYITVPISGE